MKAAEPRSRPANFGESLWALRKSRGATLEVLADRTGLSQRTIQVVEGGGGSLASVEAFARALDLALTGLPRHGDGRSIGPRLAAARLKQGLSQPEVSRKAGIDTRTLQKLEAGRGHMASLWAVLGALGRKLEVRSGEIMRRTTPADRDDRFTPPAFLAALEAVFGGIVLDPCANRLSPVVAKRTFYKEDNGLKLHWEADGLVFTNPPWSDALSWTRKAIEEHTSGRAPLIVLLLKSCTAGESFQLQHQHGDILLLKRRISFRGADGQPMGNGTVSAWPSMLTILGASAEQIAAMREKFEGVHVPRCSTL